MKRTKKTLSLILVMAMVLTLFAGVAQASAIVTISSPGARILAEDDQTPAPISISRGVDAALIAGQRTEVRITLPDGVEWSNTPSTTNIFLDGVTSTVGSISAGPALEDFERVVAFTVSSTVAVTSSEVIRFQGLAIDVPSGFRGALNADVQVTRQDALGGFISRQTTTVTIATVFTEGTTSRVRDATNILRGAGNQLVGSIEIREDLVSVFPTATGTIRLTLPDGITFATTTVTGAAGTIGFPNDRQRMTIPVAPTVPAPDTRQTISITNIRLNVAMAVGDGPVNIVIDNHPDADANVTSATLTVATVGVGAVNVSRQGDLPGAWNLGLSLIHI